MKYRMTPHTNYPEAHISELYEIKLLLRVIITNYITLFLLLAEVFFSK